MTEPDRRPSRKAVALLGGGAVLVAVTGTTAVLTLTGSATAAGGASGAGSASSQGCGNCNGNNGVGGGNGAGTGSPGKALVVAASARGVLAPGVDDTITVRLTNPNSSAIRVTRVTGQVTSVTARTTSGPVACDRAWYVVAPYSGGVAIAGNSTGSVPLQVSFVNRTGINQDRCKGASYTFNITATADQV